MEAPRIYVASINEELTEEQIKEYVPVSFCTLQLVYRL